MQANINNLSLSHKISICAIILLIPTLILGYFLVIEKDELIRFTDQEIEGMQYIKQAQQALYASTALAPSPQALQAAAELLKKADAEDKGGLSASAKTSEAVTALQAAAQGKSTTDAVTATSALITLLSDNSNITLDPDGDAYFVGDVLINQATSAITQTNAVFGAAQDLAADPSDDHKIAFAEARDGVASAASNIASDVTKALKNNATGSVKEKLSGPAKTFSDAAENLAQVLKNPANPQIKSAAQGLLDAATALNEAADDEMVLLLKKRNEGFRAVIYSRLITAALILLAGLIMGTLILASVTKPLKKITGLLREITRGNLDIDIPHFERQDEVGHLTQVLASFYEVAVTNKKTQEAEHNRLIAEQQRATYLNELNQKFKLSVTAALEPLKNTVKHLVEAADQVTEDSRQTVVEAINAAKASEQTSHNVDAVAGASEQLSASIREISDRVAETTKTSQYAVTETASAKLVVAELSKSTNKISEVVSLIHEIAAQTNLLALNATIEAARAGEAGKGFAVVASEVKLLANQTAKATDDITSHISEIQNAVNNVSTTMEHIDGIISNLNISSTGIASAIEEQSAATQEISRNAAGASQATTSLSGSISVVSAKAKASEAVSLNLMGAAKQVDQANIQINETVSSYLRDLG